MVEKQGITVTKIPDYLSNDGGEMYQIFSSLCYGEP